MPSLVELADFQEKLMEVFATAQSVDQALDRLEQEKEFQQFKEAIATWNPDMVGIAIAVTQKWAYRSVDGGEGL